MYGLTREEAVHVLDSFAVVRKYDERDHGEYRTKRLVLGAKTAWRQRLLTEARVGVPSRTSQPEKAPGMPGSCAKALSSYDRSVGPGGGDGPTA